MNDAIYAIPSYKRPKIAREKTLNTLIKGKVKPELITVWVADEKEKKEYEPFIPDRVNLEISAPTLKESRNKIVGNYPKGTRIVWCDDDLEALVIRENDRKSKECKDINSIVSEGFMAADLQGARLWGVYPTSNPLFMSSRTRTGLVFCIGVFYGHTIKKDEADIVDIHDKDDYERSIKCYIADGSCVRLDYVGVKTKYYVNPGGMQEKRTDRSADRSAVILSKRYPSLAKMYRNKKGRAEIRLKDERRKI